MFLHLLSFFLEESLIPHNLRGLLGVLKLGKECVNVSPSALLLLSFLTTLEVFGGHAQAWKTMCECFSICSPFSQMTERLPLPTFSECPHQHGLSFSCPDTSPLPSTPKPTKTLTPFLTMASLSFSKSLGLEAWFGGLASL